MKLHNSDLEMSVLYSICEADIKVRNKFLAYVTPDYFYNDYTNEAIKRVFSIIKKAEEPPTFEDLISDPVLSESTRKKLKKYEGSPITDKKYKRKLKHLQEYYQVRELYFMSERLNKLMQGEKLDIDDMLESTANDLTRIRLKKNRKQEIHHIGKSNNSSSIVKRLLDKTPPKLVPTGFSAWDDVNGGIPYKALVGIGGPAGGGKCQTYFSKIPFLNPVSIELYTVALENGKILKFWPNQPVKLLNGKTKLAKHLNTTDELDLKGSMKIASIKSEVVTTNELPIGEIYETFCAGNLDEWKDIKGFNLFTLEGVLPASRMYKTKGKTVSITLSNGEVLSGLPEHQYLTHETDKYRFVRLDKLSIGQKLLFIDDEVVEEWRERKITPNLYKHLTIEKLKFNEYEEEVYDFEVPGPHHYVSSNVFSHNTSLALQLAQNMSEIGLEDVAYVPLEMDEDETMERILSNKAGVKLSKIKQKKTSEKEDKRIARAYKNHAKKLKKNKTRLTIFAPEEDVSIDEVLLLLKPYGFRVIIVDYLTLLKGTDGDEMSEKQWQKIGQIGRKCKIWAKANDAIVILVAQVDEEGRLRYSRALKEHANILWTWPVNKETRENKVMKISTEKARNLVMVDFDLGYDDELFQVFDVSKHNDKDSKDDSTTTDEYLSNIDDEDEEDI